MRTVFLRALDADDKAAALRSAVGSDCAGDRQRFEIDAKEFGVIPRSPFAYWANEELLQLFSNLPPFESNGRTAKVGLQTSDDFRFLRSWWEIAPRDVGSRWFPFAKGGKYAPFYADVTLVVQWESGGGLLKAWAGSLYNNSHWTRILKNTEFCFRPGLTWPPTALGYVRLGMGMAVLPRGCLFAHKSCGVFEEEDDRSELLQYLALLSSRPVDILVRYMAHSRSWEVGHVQAIPFPRTNESALADLSRRAWSLKRNIDVSVESSHAFTLPALLVLQGDTLSARAAAGSDQVRDVEEELFCIQSEIDNRCFDLYGIDQSDRDIIVAALEVNVDGTGDDQESHASADGESGEEIGAENAPKAEVLATAFASWGGGAAFGRFDIRLAIGARDMPPEPEPFDALPVCSPGMLAGNDGLPLQGPPANYPMSFPETGILVDDAGHGDDLGSAIRAVFDAVFGDRADAWWNEVSAVLDPKGHDFRAWLRKDFFEYHLKLYSKSRRKAPIYWQLATASAQYSVWLYAHRLTRDSFFQLQNDVVAPKLAHEERKLASLVQGAGGSPSAKERKEIAAQESFVEELRAMLEEVKRVAPLWNPNLDDGVVLTMAPLWRLVPQHKAWQKELRLRWDELCTGKYDWAHVAMHLWPERVVPQCAKDRSLAIAHGLEDVFWVEGDDGKWTARSEPTQPVDELVKERTSSAVKAALVSLLEAPTPGASGRGRRKGARAASAKGNW